MAKKKKQIVLGAVTAALTVNARTVNNQSIEEAAKQFCLKQLDDDQENPVNLYVKGKIMECFGKAVQRGSQAYALEEISKYAKEGSVVSYGCKVARSHARSTWEYGQDPVLAKMQEELKSLQAKIKAHEKLRQAQFSTGEAMTLTEGEFAGVELTPPLKLGGKETVVVTIPDIETNL